MPTLGSSEGYRLPAARVRAARVVLAERLATRRVFTLDRRDFTIYRIGRVRFAIIPA